MASRVPPALNLAVLCSYVEFDGNGRPFSLVEPTHTISVPPRTDGKLPAPELAVYVQLDDENALGTFWFSIEVRTASGIVLPGGRSRPVEVTFDGQPDPLQLREEVFPVRDLVFPEPERYHIHVMCNHMSLHSREHTQPPLRIRAIPAEQTRG
ncbi:MAG: hypothetical protein L0241_21320 [Planctomycetia bacterium]|nr:hypothetical protein [Planctomycetia bacterium]